LTVGPSASLEDGGRVAAKIAGTGEALAFAFCIQRGILIQFELGAAALSVTAKLAAFGGSIPFAVLGHGIFRTTNVSEPAFITVAVKTFPSSLEWIVGCVDREVP
jgi:hypothetical protein